MFELDVFRGRISSSGFSGGDRLVIGDWGDSPLGEFTNIMWGKSDGSRVLMSPSELHADFVSGIYNFEEVRVVDIEVDRSRGGILVEAGKLRVSMAWGFSIPIPFPRPLWFTRMVENPLGKVIFGSKTYGITRDGRREWYSVRGIARMKSAEAVFNGENMGEMGSCHANSCFGFSEPPAWPSSVRLSAFIE